MKIRTLTLTAATLAFLMGAVSGAEKSKELDGKKKTFVVVGYSTSWLWPGVLQKMLDEHSGEKGLYQIRNAAVGGSPVAKWLGMTNERDRERTFDKMVRDYFDPGDALDGAQKPTVALLQQSLQWVYPGDRTEGIQGPDDKERIKLGADAFLKLAEQIHELGVETVYISTHIYKKPMEPGIGNEKYALQALLKQKKPFIRSGPELWEPTKKIYPDGFAGDLVHPNEKGARVMAVGWYRALAGESAKEEIFKKAESGAFDSPRRKPGGSSNRASATDRAATAPQSQFPQRDKNGDGFLTRDEFPERVRNNFDTYDADKDGKVSKQEYDARRSRARGQGGQRQRNQ